MLATVAFGEPLDGVARGALNGAHGDGWGGLATRSEKRAANYRAMVVLAALVIWLDS